jgi:hypothetical protein
VPDVVFWANCAICSVKSGLRENFDGSRVEVRINQTDALNGQSERLSVSELHKHNKALTTDYTD